MREALQSRTSDTYSDHWPLKICLMKTSIHHNDINLGTVKLFINKSQTWMQAPTAIELQHQDLKHLHPNLELPREQG
ncbi:hypothetical protein K443DRAFT_684413 [Laccaria amethystina LaAM-08-1]|uniref:Uncharacterized protein n=1 Tax=Laccaria amethystina LaAM-08-1 TaxID=1095629 RepID=A0A0C9WQU4_9AGAR|nr:hypothetical protein K443DRAFT_684413 [Laccaria amethystina LaAM-08-1]